jgi:hemolysin III
MLERRQSINEEIANSLTHGLFLLAAVICSPILIAKSIQTKDNISIITTSVFAAVVILVYFISTLYHAMPRNRAKDKLRLIDYGAIFLLIAGTYTPFALNVIKGKWGWALFSIEWILAIVGITLLYYKGLKHKGWLLLIYLIMGWLVLIAIEPFWLSLPVWGLFWIFVGGVAYTLGISYYRISHLNFRHFIWHIFVVAGTTCHSIAVFLYAV